MLIVRFIHVHKTAYFKISQLFKNYITKEHDTTSNSHFNAHTLTVFQRYLWYYTVQIELLVYNDCISLFQTVFPLNCATSTFLLETIFIIFFMYRSLRDMLKAMFCNCKYTDPAHA